MQPNPNQPLHRRRSRILLTVFLLVVVALSILAAILIQRGLQDDDLQEQLRELREAER